MTGATMLAPPWVNCSARWHVSSWSLCTGSTCQGKTPATWRRARPSQWKSPESEVQTFLPTASWYLSCQEKHNSQALDEQFFYSHEEERARTDPIICRFMARRFPQQLMQGSWPMSTALVTHQKDTCPSPLESEILIIESMPEGHWCTRLCNKGILI